MKIRLLTLLIAFTALQAQAAPSDQEAPTVVTCTHTDGYGSYSGKGSNRHEARSEASTQCFNRQVDLFEKTRGTLPDEDQAEDMIISCLNICP